MATLRSSTIKFHTNDDDKDGDTHVTVTLRDDHGVIAARIDSDFGHFNDNSENGPFGMFIKNMSPKEYLENGTVTIRIDPNGHDTWKFNFYLDMTFNDNSVLAGGHNGLVLSQDHREETYPINRIRI